MDDLCGCRCSSKAINNLVKVAVNYVGDMVEVFIQAVVSDSILRKIVRANFFRAVASADLFKSFH